MLAIRDATRTDRKLEEQVLKPSACGQQWPPALPGKTQGTERPVEALIRCAGSQEQTVEGLQLLVAGVRFERGRRQPDLLQIDSEHPCSVLQRIVGRSMPPVSGLEVSHDPDPQCSLHRAPPGESGQNSSQRKGARLTVCPSNTSF